MQVDVTLNIEGSTFYVGRLTDQGEGIAFQYDSNFLKSGLQISPFAMPLSSQVRWITNNPFSGLPGVISDALPDGWGNLLLDRQLQRRKLRLSQVSILERLCWVGSNGMGALEFEPATDVEAFGSVGNFVSRTIITGGQSSKVAHFLYGFSAGFGVCGGGGGGAHA